MINEKFRALQRRCDMRNNELAYLIKVDPKTLDKYRDGLSAVPVSVIKKMNIIISFNKGKL